MPLLFDVHCFRILFDSFKFYNEKYKAKLLAYVLMNSHIHFIIFFERDNHLIDYIRDFKEFTSLKLKEYIQAQQAEPLQNIEYEHRTQHFKVWTDRYDDVYLHSRDLCETKINYIHNNPVKAGLVSTPVDYPFSSAAFYEGKRAKSQLMHYRDLF